MKALIYCQEALAQNLLHYLPKSHGYLLPFLNKPLLTHWLESLYQLGVREVRIVAQRSWILQEALGHGQALGLKLSFQSGSEQDDLQTVLQKNQGFIQQEPLLCVRGYGLLLPPEALLCLRLQAGTPLALHAPNAPIQLYWLPSPDQLLESATPLPTAQQLQSQALSDVQSYYLAQLGLLASDVAGLNLPAYGALQDGQAGAGLQLHPSARVSGHSLLGHRCQLEAQTTITQSVLGEDVVVATGTTLSQCLVLSGSWIGPHLHLEHKLIVGQTLIDPFSAEVLDFQAADFFADLKQSRAVVPLWHRLLAGLLYGSRHLSGKRRLLRQVMLGQRRLIDSATLNPGADSADLITYADALGHHDPFQRQLDNLCYQQQRTLKMELLLCWLWLKQSLVQRAAKFPELLITSPTTASEALYTQIQFGSEPLPDKAFLSAKSR